MLEAALSAAYRRRLDAALAAPGTGPEPAAP
jgi:hypothetical protein